MGNQWFQCKQFLIKQDKTAMKVGTDGMLLGAWTMIPSNGNALDVGTGTGLIALMIAQRNTELNIKAIEIENNAYIQATENVKESKWSHKIDVKHCSFLDFALHKTELYDLIICNPPFYKTNNPGSNTTRAMARHAGSLTLTDLIHLSSGILSDDGILSLILPSEQFEAAKEIGFQNNLFLRRVTYVKPTPQKKPHRVLLQFGKNKSTTHEDELILEEYGRHQYSDKFKKLVEPFYIRFSK